jgi:hypothetical protein
MQFAARINLIVAAPSLDLAWFWFAFFQTRNNHTQMQ